MLCALSESTLPMPPSGRTLILQPAELAVCRLTSPLPPIAGGFWSLTRTADEVSLVCEADAAPADARIERGWRALRVAGTIDFGQVGLLAGIAQPLAAAGVSIFALSTFDTDYVLVKSDRLGAAMRALSAAGHAIELSAALRERAAVQPAAFPADAAIVADLFREYAASLDFSLGYQGFEAELAALPGKYASPGGGVLLAIVDGVAAGCVAMRAIERPPDGPEPVCEMKRMYVRPAFRGLKLGRRLAEQLLAAARAAGYRRMLLDSESTFTAAVTLYRSLGFVEIPRYNDDPMPCTLWMEHRW